VDWRIAEAAGRTQAFGRNGEGDHQVSRIEWLLDLCTIDGRDGVQGERRVYRFYPASFQEEMAQLVALGPHGTEKPLCIRSQERHALKHRLEHLRR
jgi:hypothetical protein